MRLITHRDACQCRHLSPPPRLLQDGDILTVTVERVGELTNTCRTGPAMED